MHLTDVMCNRNIPIKLTKQSVQDGYKTSHMWRIMVQNVGQFEREGRDEVVAVTKCRPRATVAANVGHAQQVN